MAVVKYAHIAARILSRPLLLEPQYASVFFSAFGRRAGLTDIVGVDGQDIDLESTLESYQVRQRRYASGDNEPYAVIDGVAVVSMEGSLVHKMGTMDPVSGMQGYDGIAAKLDAAANDPRAKAILLNVDSPGGEVSGAFDLADKVAQVRSRKPVFAYADDMMASAAFLVASQAQGIFASQTANIGSVGVLLAHTDNSKRMESAGVKVTLIHSGKHKVDGNPYGPLPEEVQAELQSEIDGIRDKFAQYVANGRKMSKTDVLATEARTYGATAAVNTGFADGVMSFDAAISHISSTFARSGETPRGKTMSAELNVVTASSPGLTDAEVEKLMSDARNEGVKEGAANERARIQAIVGHPDAQGREATARHLAFATDMAPEAAIALLNTTPKASAVQDIAAGMMAGAGVQAEPEAPTTIAEDQALVAATQAALSRMFAKT